MDSKKSENRIGPLGQWIITQLITLSAAAYFLLSHGIRNYAAFLWESIGKVLAALGVSA